MRKVLYLVVTPDFEVVGPLARGLFAGEDEGEGYEGGEEPDKDDKEARTTVCQMGAHWEDDTEETIASDQRQC